MRLRSAFSVDWLIVAPVAYLLFLGYLLQQSLHDSGNAAVDFTTQQLAIGLGVLALVGASRISMSVVSKSSKWLWLLSVVLLTATIAIGSDLQGSRRWIEIGSFQFQTSELAKMALIFMTAFVIARYKTKIVSLPSSVRITTIMVVPVVLIFLQPDLGTSIVLAAVWASMLAFARVRPLIIASSVVLIAALGIFLSLNLQPYQQDRISTFFNPLSDTQGAGYNVLQASIAIGSGGLLGEGLDSGSQSQLNFLPAAHTDFIFAVGAEKLGFLGALSIVLAFGLLISRAVMIAWTATNEYSRFVAAGIGVLLFIQVAVNIGMNVGVMPVTGLPLPLLSYGGTHVVIELILLGILMNIGRASSTLAKA